MLATLISWFLRTKNYSIFARYLNEIEQERKQLMIPSALDSELVLFPTGYVDINVRD